MVKQNHSKNSDVTSQPSHRCNQRCLGPLTFHPEAVGHMVRLSHGNRLAERNKNTFKDGLVFSSRQVTPQERVRFRVEGDLFNWRGTLRVGFTNVSPSQRSLPLPSMTIPNLTNSPGHWAAPLQESFCQVGSELEFWVCSRGSVYVTCDNSEKQTLLSGVDLSQPLWAMIDIYGQTYSISLLGSEKRGLIHRRSCPAPEPLISPESNTHLSLVPGLSGLDEDSDEDMGCQDMDVSEDNSCVVCMAKEARVTLACGHRCLCQHCCTKVSQKFGTCPLCRQQIRAPPQQSRRVSALS